MYKKIIVKCQKIVEKEALELRQRYKFTVKKLNTIQCFKKNKGGTVKASKAGKEIKTKAGRLFLELKRKHQPDS